MVTCGEPELAFPTALRACVQRRDPAWPTEGVRLYFLGHRGIVPVPVSFSRLALVLKPYPSYLWFYSLLLRLNLLPEYHKDTHYHPSFPGYIYSFLGMSSQTATAGRSQRTSSSCWLPSVTISGGPWTEIQPHLLGSL